MKKFFDDRSFETVKHLYVKTLKQLFPEKDESILNAVIVQEKGNWNLIVDFLVNNDVSSVEASEEDRSETPCEESCRDIRYNQPTSPRIAFPKELGENGVYTNLFGSVQERNSL